MSLIRRQFITMEHVEGETLQTIIEVGDLTLAEALEYGNQITDALAAAHEKDIIHRDIKPANIMVDGDGRIKVMDFGLAKLKHNQDITKTGSTVGTLAYMSPEQIQGKPVGPLSDLFSLGVVFFEMLAGARPFRGEHEAAMTYAIVNEDPASIKDFVPEAPEKLERFFGKALAKEPEERFGSAGKMNEALENLKEAIEVPASNARPAKAETRAGESSQKNKTKDSSTTISFTLPGLNLGKLGLGKLGLLVGATALLVVILLGGWWLVGEEPSAVEKSPNITERSVAVLPFTNLSGSEQVTSVARGLHDDLLTRLSNISDLQVTSRTSVERYRGTELSLPAVAESLVVQWVVEGGVQKAGGLMQVNAQLIDPGTDAHIWADSYQRELNAEKLFAIQGEIAGEIASALKAELSEGEQQRIAGAPTQNLEAYRLYVKGRKRLAELSFSDGEPVVESLHLFQRAVKEDSNFALAWAGVADAASYYDPSNWPDTAQVPIASQREAAKRALELEPDLAEAHASMGLVHLQNGNGPQAVRQLQKAIELKHSYWEAHHWLGVFNLKTGRVEPALNHLTLAVELNPQHARARHGLYDAYLAAGKAKESLEEARHQQRLGLEEVSAIGGEVRALKGLGKYEEARRIAQEQIQQLGPETVWGSWFRAYLVGILAAEGDTARAREHLEELKAAEVFPAKIGHAYAALGEVDRAFKAYEQLSDDDWQRFGPSVEFRYGVMYDLDPLRADPRYERLIRKANQAWGLNPDGSIPEDYESPDDL